MSAETPASIAAAGSTRLTVGDVTVPSNDQQLPSEIREAIAVANALSIGVEPAVLSNTSLATQVFDVILQQQRSLQLAQASAQLRIAAVAKLAEIMLKIDPTATDAVQQVRATLAQFDEWAGSR